MESIMNSQPPADKRLSANRRILLGTHAGLALLSTFVYLSQASVPFDAIVGSRSGLGIILIALPAILPYVVSGIYAWRLISKRRLGLYLYLAATMVGTAVASLVIVGAFDIPVNAETIFWYALGQIAVYGMAAEFLLRIEWP
jgi:hypothetical protein